MILCRTILYLIELLIFELRTSNVYFLVSVQNQVFSMGATYNQGQITFFL